MKNKYTIGIDGNEANVENRVGVNKYAFEIICSLKKENENRQVPHSLIVYLKNKPLPDFPKETDNFKYRILNGSGLWVITRLMPHLWLNPEKVDILFSPSHYVPLILTIPRVCSIMDLGYLEFSGQFTKKVFWQLKYWTAISVFVSKQVLTISKSAKGDIVRHYPFASKKTTVTLLGFENDKFNLNISRDLVRQVKNKYSIVDDYIAYVSTLKPSKNVDGLVEAYGLLKSDKAFKSLPQLVIAGKKGWMYESIYKKVKELGLEKDVIFTDFLPDNEKPALIAGSKAFVLPSFWEGFGIDILSAFGCGVPVVTSNVGSIPEVGGEAAIYVNPNKVESIADGIKKVLKMGKEEYNRRVKLGIEQSRKFSWEKCAKLTLETIENAI
jgi:glycosyltransferase involved in cell wall biosynthesis